MKENFDKLVQHLLTANIFLEQAVEVLERSMIEGALARTGGNRSAASKQLGIHRNTMQRKMREYGLGDGRVRIRRKPAGRVAARGRKTGAA